MNHKHQSRYNGELYSIRWQGHFWPNPLGFCLWWWNIDLKRKLNALVIRKTRYKDVNNKPLILSFGLGKDIAVDNSVGKLDLEEWIANIYCYEYFLVPNQINTKFMLNYRIAKSQIPVNVIFDRKYFVRSTKPTQGG